MAGAIHEKRYATQLKTNKETMKATETSKKKFLRAWANHVATSACGSSDHLKNTGLAATTPYKVSACRTAKR